MAQRIARRCFGNRRARWPLAVDVACGTGMFTVELAQLADRVIGIDASRAMLARAKPDPRIEYRAGDASRLGLDGGSANAITCGLAFHWLDQAAFLAEASRVLERRGWLIVFGDRCRWRYPGDAKRRLAAWSSLYLERFPPVPRYHHNVRAKAAARGGFAIAATERFVYRIPFSLDDFVEYLTTVSNVIAIAASRSSRLREARAWLRTSLRPIFAGRPLEIEFGCSIQYLRKQRWGRRVSG
ncbi:MAG TPA: class I SAM-dependent methyltransferase [Candidatus Eremiobacteraceae bacterium]|nr:class I SAM-dependent methyltransferase [Candidatus Eremiobacteraceae bacterium]